MEPLQREIATLEHMLAESDALAKLRGGPRSKNLDTNANGPVSFLIPGRIISTGRNVDIINVIPHNDF